MLEGESGTGDGLMVVHHLHLESWNETYWTVSLCSKVRNRVITSSSFEGSRHELQPTFSTVVLVVVVNVVAERIRWCLNVFGHGKWDKR
jgi:hypothetical protein